MKWSAVSTLLAAPLAIAGSLQADVIARNEGKEIRNYMGQGKDDYGYGSSGQTEVIVEQVVLIWSCNGGGESTKTVNQMSTMGSAPMATHTVIVGGSAGLVYTPETLSANVGDMVVFTFMSQNHTVTQSAFAKPCEAISGGWDSGFKPNPNNTVSPPPQMGMQVKVSTPLWFFCEQKSHCGKGMTFSINPTANKTQEMFKQMAIAQNGTGTTAAIVATAPPTGATTTTVVVAPSTTEMAMPAATSGSSSYGSGMISQGSGSTNSAGECSCSCFCGVSDYPSNVQGLMGFGGMSGSMPMSSHKKR